MSGDDVLWRRSKLGLHYSDAQRAAVIDWMASHPLASHNAPHHGKASPHSGLDGADTAAPTPLPPNREVAR